MAGWQTYDFEEPVKLGEWQPAPPPVPMQNETIAPQARPEQPASAFRRPADYWGVDEKTANTLPLGLRHSNNLFNIKYFRGAERDQKKWPGLMGPSQARDQGDPQMLFRDPEDSGVAAAHLLRRKYDSGMRTPRDIIAGRMGWTPGRLDSAAAVAKYAGIGLDDDLNLADPTAMKRFMTALATQEHGTWARDNLFAKKPDLFDRITQRYLGGPVTETAGAPAPSASSVAPGPAASASPRRKPMPDSSGGGFFSFLSKPMNILGNPENADILSRAGPQGYQPIDGEAFLAKHNLQNVPGAKDLIAISNMQRELTSQALQPQPVTWGQGIGEALKGVGAVLSSRVSPQLGYQMAGTVGQSHREQQEMMKKLQLQALLQQASGLGDNLSDTLKTRLAEQHKRELKDAALARIYGGAAPTAAGAGAPAGTAPVGAVSREEIGAPGGAPTPSAGPVPAAPAAGPPPAVGNAPTTNTAPAGAQPGAAASVPGTSAQFPQPDLPPPSPRVQQLLEISRRAAMEGDKTIADNAAKEAEDLRKDELERWKLRTQPQREAAEAAAKKEAEIAAGEQQKRQKARENATAMGGLFDNLKKHGDVKGLEGIIGPFDNSYVGRMIADFKPWGPSGADAGVRSLIEGDMAALSAIAKKITHNPGDGNFSDSDQQLLIKAIGAVLDAPNKEAYDKAIDEAKARAEKLLGTSIPSTRPTSTGETATKETSTEAAKARSASSIDEIMKMPDGQTVLYKGQPYIKKGTQLIPAGAQQAAAPAAPAVGVESRIAQENPRLTPQQRMQMAAKRMLER